MLPPAVYQLLVGIFASLGAFLYGYDLAVIASVLISRTFLTQFNDPDKVDQGLVVSMFTTGAFFGAALAGPAGDKLGRRGTIVGGAFLFLLGGGLQTGAQTVSYLWGGRFVAGLGVGALCMMVPLYQAELAHPSIRGRITALQQLMIGVGAFIAAWIGYACYVGLDGSMAQWRLPLGIQLIPAVFLGTLTFLFPESPRWLMNRGKHDAALATLARLHSNGDTNDPFVKLEFAHIQASIEHEKQHASKSYRALFKKRSSLRRLILCTAIQASVQMTGVSAIQYYSPTIYAQIGISNTDTLKYQGISNGLAIIAQSCAMLLIDRTGRRWPLIGGNLFNAVTFIIGTILLAKFPPGESKNLGAQWGFIVVTWMYNFSFSATCGPLSWIIPAEVFDTYTRSMGVSIATMTSFAFNTMIGQVTPIAMERIGYRFYYLFIACNITNAIFFWLFLPETARRPLEAMKTLFESHSWIVVGTTSKTAWDGDREAQIEQVQENVEVHEVGVKTEDTR